MAGPALKLTEVVQVAPAPFEWGALVPLSCPCLSSVAEERLGGWRAGPGLLERTLQGRNWLDLGSAQRPEPAGSGRAVGVPWVHPYRERILKDSTAAWAPE